MTSLPLTSIIQVTGTFQRIGSAAKQWSDESELKFKVEPEREWDIELQRSIAQ